MFINMEKILVGVRKSSLGKAAKRLVRDYAPDKALKKLSREVIDPLGKKARYISAKARNGRRRGAAFATSAGRSGSSKLSGVLAPAGIALLAAGILFKIKKS
jgi:hypothetical protein